MNIINRSLTTGVFPDNLQKACVTPIPKEVYKCNLSNYSPISVLPVFSKVFEKLAHKQLFDYLENNSILNKQQYVAFVLQTQLLRPLYISYNTCISK